jgi:hypothetical protein
MRRLTILTAGLTVGASLALTPILAGPASAHGNKGTDLREVRTSLLAGGDDSSVLSGNVKHLGNRPGTAGISGCFMKTAPLFVTSGVESVRVWNLKDATDPTQVGVLPNALFENEAMNCGERRTADGTRRFSLIGVDSVDASPSDPQHTNVGGNELIVVDVTHPASPEIVGRAPATTSTHTVACVDEYDCSYAYSAGDNSSGTFSIIDLRNIEKPKEVDSNPDKAGVQAFHTPTAGPKWNIDNARNGTHTGWDGSSMWNLSRPQDTSGTSTPPATAPTPASTAPPCGTSATPQRRGWSPRPGSPARATTRPTRAGTTSSCTTPSGPTPPRSSPTPRPRSRTATCCW